MRTPVPKKDVSANIHYHFSPIFKGNNPNVYPQEGNKQTGVNPHNGCDPASKSNKLLTRATTWLVALRTFCWTKGARHKEHKKSWNRQNWSNGDREQISKCLGPGTLTTKGHKRTGWGRWQKSTYVFYTLINTSGYRNISVHQNSSNYNLKIYAF